ncbi:SseB family protein [Cryptosporangium sp. NPDC048952]|uniref:SseB family protein n=1 Tax=Cryptosporangium sp. NPDC048952 TaxID=3363961 RepID=UPI00371F93B1
MRTSVVGVTVTSWRPANRVEVLLYHALLRSDASRFFALVAESPLYVPALSGQLVTWTRGDRSFVPAFTSAEGLAHVVGAEADTVLQMSYEALAKDWPDPSWWLALNPTTLIDATVPVPWGELPSLPVVSSGLDLEATPAEGSSPANELEEAMREVLAQGSVPLLLDLLVFAEVLLPTLRPTTSVALDDPYFPWAALPTDEPELGVFTSPARLAEASGGADVPSVRVPLMSVVQAWPGAEYALVVNPGSSLRARLPAGQVPALSEWARVAAAYHGVAEP